MAGQRLSILLFFYEETDLGCVPSNKSAHGTSHLACYKRFTDLLKREVNLFIHEGRRIEAIETQIKLLCRSIYSTVLV